MNKKILTVTLNPAIDYSVSVPDFKIDHVNRADRGQRDPGGKGINTATVTSGLGIETAVTGFLGTRNCGIFNEHFESCAIKDRFIYIDGVTREGIKISDRTQQLTTDINFTGFRVDTQQLQLFLHRFEELSSGYDYILMSGSIPEGLPADIYNRLTAIASQAGAFTTVDTSGKNLRDVVDSGQLNLIKPNIAELLESFLKPSEVENLPDFDAKLTAADRIARSLLKKVEMVALSLGGAGSRLYTADAVYQANAPVVTVASTVGAGDSFLGGLIAGFVFGKDDAGALQMAAAAAASKLTKLGPGLCEINPLGAFYDAVRVEKL